VESCPLIDSMLTAFLYLNFLDCPVMGPCPGMDLSTLVPSMECQKGHAFTIPQPLERFSRPVKRFFRPMERFSRPVERFCRPVESGCLNSHTYTIYYTCPSTPIYYINFLSQETSSALPGHEKVHPLDRERHRIGSRTKRQGFGT
jgi:hypothetical protein